MFSIFLLYLNIIELTTVNSFNVSSVLQLYNAVCGNAVCEESLITDGRTVENLLTTDRLCPACTCEKTCLVSGNCCPDIFFSIKPSCMKMDVLSENPSFQESKSIYAISNCPPGSDKETKRLCEMEYDTIERIKNVPVSSKQSGLTYKNLHCSKCSNESVENLISLDIEIDCAEFTDFNFLSSFDELISVAKHKKCTMFFTDKDIFPPPRSCIVDENVVNSCNVTGTWTMYNPDVDYACKAYDNKFHFFKNVFCYICNPPKIVGDIIGQCNVTGLWFPFDVELENACLRTVQTSVTGKFKNIYCFLCNKNNTDVLPRFNDIRVSVSERAEMVTDRWLMKSFKFIFDFDILDVNIDRVLQSGNSYLMLHNVQTNDSSSVSVNYTEKNGSTSSIDILNVLQKYYAYTGISDFCHNYSLFETIHPCYCNDECYFTSYGCCTDKYFHKSTMCTEDKYSTSGRRFLVYDFCTNNQQNFVLDKLCQINDERNVFLFLPTLFITNNGRNEHYKNIYCALCNGNKNSKQKVFPWKLKLECDLYIPSYFHLSLEEYFSFVIDNSCHFYYEYDYYKSEVMTCEQQTYDHCNTTGLWKQYDTDILEACENYNIPSGSICSLCNPENNNEIIYSACNATGMWNNYDPYLYKNCLKYPAIQTFAPYKNYFCKECNKNSFPEPLITTTNRPSTTTTHYPPPPTYRVIFAFSNYKEPPQETPTTQCNESQILNKFKNDCRDMMCYPGRFLQDTGCLPLLQTTQNLGYILSIGIEGELQYSVDTPLEFLKAVRSSFESFINDLLQLPYLDIESSYFVPNITCSETTKWINGTKVAISIYKKFFIGHFVNRTDVEQKLVLLPGTIFNVSYINLIYQFEMLKDEKSIFLPNYITKIGFAEYCFLTLTSKNWEAEQYVHSHVNNLLLCQQIELTRNELEIDTKTLKLKIKFTDTDLIHDQYLLSSSGGARICIETFRQLSRYTSSQKKSFTAWDVIQIICTCVSLICLLSTFVTYCLFPSIRTLPGKNNMCLVFAMFCTHFLFQFVIIGKNSDTGCQILGVLLHYFWLVTLACLNVCSFHMFRVFRSKTVVKLSEKCELIKYIFYSFSTPAFIVLLNISVTAGVSGGSRVGYGGHVCFLSNKTAYIVTFVVPIVLICFLNIFFFAVTAATIARRPKLNLADQMHPNQIHFVVYIKLFTITGVSWIFQVIDSFLPASIFSYIISILNTLQGVFIFISYVCNKRVYMLYKNSRKTIYKSTNSPTKTVTTRLNESST